MAKPPHDLKGIASLLAKQGRGGDTMLAHINPQEAELLKSLGGAGTINPETGLPEFWSFNIGPVEFSDDGVDYDPGWGLGVGNITGSGGLLGKAVETARGITGAAAGAVENAAQKLGQTVEAIVSDPKKLAAVGLMIAFPGAAGAVGDFILGDALAVDALVASGAMTASEAALVGTASLGSGTAASAIVGQAAINAATNGGNVEQAVKAALIQQGLPAALKSDVMQSLNKDMVDVLGKYGAQATTQAGLAAIMGKDPVAAFVFSGASSAAGLITKEIPGFSDMPSYAQKAINATVLAKLTGKDAATAAADSLVASATQAAKHGFAVQDAVMKSNGTVLDEKQLSETENITPQQAVKVSDISQRYGRDFSGLVSAMEKQNEIPDAVKAQEDTYQSIFKKVGDNLYTFAGGGSQPDWVLNDKGEVARIKGEMLLYDNNDGTIQTYSGSITVDPKTGDDIRKTYSKAAGFGDDFQSWMDAKALGITNQNDYASYLEQQAKASPTQGIEQLAETQPKTIVPPTQQLAQETQTQTQEPPAQGGIEQLAETQPETIVPPTQQLAQETTGGLDQLINAINNPETTSSYTGTNVADVSGGITGLPSDQPTDQDLAQLGVGLPTGLTDTTDQGGVDVGDGGISSLLDQGQTGNGYQQGEGAFTGIDTGTVASDQTTGGTGMEDYFDGGDGAFLGSYEDAGDGIAGPGGEGSFPGINDGTVGSDQTNELDAGQGEGAFPGTEPGTVASDQPGGDTGLTPGMWQQLSTATGLPVNTLKLLGAGLGAAGLGSLFNRQQTAPAPTPYTGPLSNIQYNPATYTPYTYKPYAGGGAVESMSNANAIGANTGFPMADIQRGAYSTPYQQPISQNVVTGAQDTRVDPYTGEERLAMGGIANLGGYSDGGRLLRGPGDGVSDSIPAVIGGKQPARLADGEFVIPARIVSELGNGSTEAGARQLYAMMDRIQAARRKTVGKDKVAANTKASKHLPA